MLGVVVACLVQPDPRPATAADPPRPAGAPAIRTSRSPYRVRVGVRPALVELGQRVSYRAGLTEGGEGTIRLLPPEAGGVFSWGTPRIYTRQGWRRRSEPQPFARHPIQTLDTMGIEVPLQAFALGQLSVPGLRVEIDDGRGPRIVQLPTVTVTVVPVLTAADSNADFRAVHGPLAAPWWERVPWTWVILGLLVIAAIVALVVWRRRHRAAAAAPVAGLESRDPLAEALAALASLRGLSLPEHGRFAEHAFRLGQILRRYLEAVIRTTRPGDTTPELVAHLRQAGLESDDLTRLSGLLRAWDQVKFAREPFTFEDAIRTERATEAFLRRPAASVEKVA
jgi:hypothetical protein